MKHKLRGLLSLALALCLTLSLLPGTALAYVGPVRTTEAEAKAVTATTVNNGGIQYLVLQNDYITFAVQASGGRTSSLRSYTVPTAQLKSLSDIFRFPAETNRFSVSEGEQVNLSAARQMDITGISGRIDRENGYPSLEVSLTFSDNRLTGGISFHLERLNRGEWEGTISEGGESIGKDPEEEGNHWAVASSTYFSLTRAGWDQLGTDDNIYPYHVKEYPLSTMGHGATQSTASVLLSIVEETWERYRFQQAKFSVRNISGGLGCTLAQWRTNTGNDSWISTSYTEAYTSNYVTANPFVGLSSFYYVDSSSGIQGVEGHDFTYYPRHVESNGSNVTTYGYDHNDPMGIMDNMDSCFFQSIWGFRDLYKPGDTTAPTDPDQVTVSSNADRLAVYVNGSSVTVTPVSGSGAVSGSPVAVIRGSFKLENGAYTFTSGAAALSPSVTATWNTDEGGYFRVKTNGAIEQKGVHLNAPGFKFYAPKSGSESALTLSFAGDGLRMAGMGNNDAVISVNIPNTKTTVTQGTAKADGSLTFTGGSLTFDNLFSGAAFQIAELRYSVKNGGVSVDGVRTANSSLYNTDVLGIDLFTLKGVIDTFKNTYNFTTDIDVFKILQANGELQLKRTSSGELMPNNLYFEVDSKIGLSLVPPAPVVKLTGGGAGFYNLVTTLNGNWYAVPPITFRGSVDGEIINVLEADGANIVIGPSQFELSVNSLGFKGGKSYGIFSGGIGMYLGGNTVTYKNVSYQGVDISGRVWLRVDLPSKSNNFLVFDGSLAAGVFGGINGNNLYARVYGNSTSSVKLQTPDDWAIIGGITLLGASVDIAAAGQTVIEKGRFSSLFDNLDVQIGLAATASVLGSDVRGWVILPDVAQNSQKNRNWGLDFKLWGSLPRWSWEGRLSGFSAASLRSARGVSLLGTTGPQTISIQDITSDEQNAYLVLSFPETITEDQLKANLSVTKNGDSTFSFTPVWLETTTTADGEIQITNGDTANVMSGVAPLEDGTGNERVLVIKVGQGASANGTYTVSVDDTLTVNYSDGAVVNPFDTLGDVTFTGSSVSGSVKWPENGAKYVVRTYLATEKGGTDYLVDETELTGTTFGVSVPTSGTAAPTGSYYLTTYLMKEMSYTDDDSTAQTGYIAIGSASSDSTISYTNSMTPDAPTAVTLTAVGNEVMTASWPAVDNADGYRITIYNADGSDTGRGYEYGAGQFSEISGLHYDAETDTYSLDMAMTVAGAATEDGTPDPLEAGKEYQIGVTAYKSQAVNLGEEETQDVKYYSVETKSDPEFLPAYQDLDMTIKVDDNVLAPDDDGIYNATLPGYGLSYLIVSADAQDATFQVVCTNNEEEIEGSNGAFWIPDADLDAGILMLEVTGSVTHDGVTDTTTRYVLVSLDDTAPILTLDAEIFYADPKTRDYAVTGVTEPGSTVTMLYIGQDEDGYEETKTLDTTADAEGRFSLEHALPEDVDGMFLQLQATDMAGNYTSGSTLVSLGTETQEPEPEPDPKPDSKPGTSTTPEPDTSSPFTDVFKSDYYYDAVLWAVEQNITKGTSATTFSPNATVTRAQAVTFLWRAYGEPAATGTNPFIDVSKDAYYYDAVLWAVEEGITKGTSATTFSPDDPVTRAQAVTFLWRAAGEPAVTGSSFADVAADAYYAGAVQWAVSEDITKGTSATTFSPDSIVTRAQIVTFLWRQLA